MPVHFAGRHLALITALTLAAVPAVAAHPTSAGLMIASATSAAPASIGAKAAVMAGDGKLLRKGSNGWTCMPDNPATPGPDPMCFDKGGLHWAMAWMAHKLPTPSTIGFAYMLAGGVDASNTDPFATKPAAKWVRTGPHLMILNAAVAEGSPYPSREAKPDTSKPYVMFGGTPYAHIMMPTN
ncbi:hypothetical protein [Sphingomonas sp. RB1R13]|uniref:hypothetical protein n=1 Tax=Sphingomonas sp. RB1R13 TaxID=3096159 RepID=UPI002FCC29DF